MKLNLVLSKASLIGLCIFLLATPVSLASGREEKNVSDSLMNIYAGRKYSFDVSLLLGLGTKNITVGKTTENKDITMSGGGGISGVFDIMYTINPLWEVGVSVGVQKSSLMPKVENAEAGFSRVMLLLTVKRDIQVSERGLLKFGFGGGYYIPGDLDMDLSRVPSGAHNIYSYDNNVGFHALVEYESILSQQWSWGVALQYYNVSYTLNAVKSNGVNIPVSNLPQTVKDEVGELDGGSVNISFFVAYHLY